MVVLCYLDQRPPLSSGKGGTSVYSEEVGLSHDAHELLLRDLAIAITVSLLDHLLDLVVCHVLA